MNRILTLFLALFVVGSFSARAQVVNFNGYYHQDFDTLENNGTTGDSMPNGWYFYENSTTAGPTTYVIESGSGTSGNTYSYGSAGSSDRALGTLASGSNQPIIGVAFKNTTGRTVDTIRIVFRVEQWRLGQKSSGTVSRPLDSMLAEMNPAATSLNYTGIVPWQRIRQLNLYTVDTTGTTGPVNGNSDKYSMIVDQTFTGLKIPNGQTVWIRWSDPNITGSDDGLAIDSFTMLIPEPPVPVVGFNTTNATVEEGDSVHITLNIANANTSATSVNVDVLSSSTASSTSDYTFTSGNTYTFPASSSTAVSFWVKTIDDNKVEKPETLRLMLSNITNNGMYGDSVFTITITDNDTTQTYKIRDVKFPQTAGVPDTTKYGFLHGVVISPDFDGKGGIQFALEDSTGAIAIANPSTNLGYTVKMGDSLIVRGKVSSLYYTTFILADSIWVKNSNNTIPAATVTTTLNDNNESDLVTVKNLKLVDRTKWNAVTGSGGFYVTATNGSKTFDIFIDEDTDLFKRSAPSFLFDITGIVTQVGLTATTGYGLVPRGMNDLTELVYPMYKIAQVKTVNANGVPDSLNKKVWLKGIVQSPTYRPNSFEFSLQDSTAGIIVFRTPGNFGYTPNVGDSVMVLGTVVNFNGLTELTVAPSDTLIVLSTNGFPIAAQTVTEFTEDVEGSLIRLENVTIINPAQWTKTGSGFNVDITNGVDTFQMRIDADVDLYKSTAPTGRFNVTGVLTQFDNSSPYTTGYQLLPRSSNDIELIVEPEPVYMEYTISEVSRTDFTSGVADSLGVKAWVRGIVHSETFNPSTLEFSLIDNTGGIIVTSNTTNLGYSAVRGDSIRVLGTVMQNNGLTTFEADSIVKLNSGNTLIPAAVGGSALLEGNEGSLVKLEGVQLVNASEWTTGQGAEGFNVHVYKGTDTFMVHIDKDVQLYNMAAPTGTLNITGVLYQNDSISPYLSNYYIMPRDSMDITAGLGIAENNKNTNNVMVYPNPAATNITVKADFVADMIIVTDVMGREVVRYAPTRISENINITALKPGMYFVKIQKDGNIATQKLYKY